MESSPVADPADKVYIVLGCRRSGTSFVAEALGELGIEFDICGNGHNEDQAFCQLNQEVLTEAGGDWSDLPRPERIAEAVRELQSRWRDLLDRKRRRRWGWKDPRQGATIEYLLPLLDKKDDVYLVCVFRRPERVAESMHRTWGTPRAEGRRIYNDYVRRILSAVEAFAELW